ncbi:MAG: SAF domain-containing protein [Clostridiales Family XIII bacterium]|nr:SAF domain-containing protein [Clostridiales Family XIII bacterium]
MKRWRPALGVLLAILSVAGLVFWETTGRSKLLMDRVVVAGADIRAGAVVRADMLATVLVPKDGVIENGFSAGREKEIVGKRTAWPVSARQQLSSDVFALEESYLKEGESFFVIPAAWIAMRSSALRRGDTVEIASALGDGTGLGRYRLAFVKDAGELEVRDMLPSGETLSETLDRKSRTDANAMIDHVEIIATKAAYETIRAFAESAGAPSLLLIQREG